MLVTARVSALQISAIFVVNNCQHHHQHQCLCDVGSAVPKHQEWEAELAKELAMQRSQHRHMAVKS